MTPQEFFKKDCFADKAGVELIETNYFGGRQYREVFEENRALITELKKIPVSYTHLDVYKRQD